jgi:hypothetical protein
MREYRSQYVIELITAKKKEKEGGRKWIRPEGKEWKRTDP